MVYTSYIEIGGIMAEKLVRVLFTLSRQTIEKLNMMDQIRTVIAGKGNNKSQLVREAIDDLWLKYQRNEREDKQ
jgi:hypothetical protein